MLIVHVCKHPARAAGATSPGECVACRKGFFKDEEYAWDTMCEPCQPCAAGEYRADCGWGRAGECTACPTGTHKTEGLAGSAWDTKCDRCEPCPAGKKRVGCGLESAGTCDDCEAGTYKDGAYFWDFGSAGANSGLPLDQAAKLGRLAAPTKAGGECSRCMPCPPGSYLDGCGGASPGSCVQCPAGEFKPEGLEEGPAGWDTACTPLAADSNVNGSSSMIIDSLGPPQYQPAWELGTAYTSRASQTPSFEGQLNCEGHDRIRKPATRRTRTAERCG